MNIRHFSHRGSQRILGILGVSTLALGLAACDKQGQPTVGQKLDSGVQQTERAETIAKGVKGVMSVTNNHKVAV